MMYLTTDLGYRKRAMAEVWISNGNGEIVINDIPLIEYFRKQEDRFVFRYGIRQRPSST